jgi:two-component system LytT family response regulator
MINCVAIDDEPLALEVLKKYTSRLPDLQLMMTFSDAIEAVAYLQKNQVDLLFLDIQMPDINGFQLYNNLAIKPMVIFTTAYKEFAVEGFEVDAIDYLLKPFNLARFEKAVTKALSRENSKEKEETPSQYLYIHADYKMVKIPFAEIIFMEALDDYVKVVTGTQSYLTLLSMKKMLDKLPKKQFIRIHRSYIVAIDKITFLQYRKIGLPNNLELPVGDTYRTEISALKRQD